MIGEEKSQAQPRNVETGRIITRAIPLARGVATTEPGSPIHGFLAIRGGRGEIGLGRLATTRAGVRGTARLDLAGSDPKQMTLVLEHAPQLPSYRGIVAPIAKASPDASTAPFGFERGQVFPTDQATVVEQGQQDQQ